MRKEFKEVAIDQLKHPPRNSRIHPEHQVREIRRSLKKYGQYKNAVIDENNTILVGNGLIEAMKSEGFKKALVAVAYDLTENEKTKLMLADNKTYGLGVDDLENIQSLIAELQGDFDIPGFDDVVLKSISASAEEISQVLESYGTATNENLLNIEARSDINRPPSDESEPARDAREDPEYSEGQSIVCPKCGEVIWL
jgi:hypothetical protein